MLEYSCDGADDEFVWKVPRLMLPQRTRASARSARHAAGYHVDCTAPSAEAFALVVAAADDPDDASPDEELPDDEELLELPDSSAGAAAAVFFGSGLAQDLQPSKRLHLQSISFCFTCSIIMTLTAS